jgi:hypothetical protein
MLITTKHHHHVASMPRRKTTTYSMLWWNGRTTHAPSPTEPERSWSPSHIFNAGISEEDKAESILLDAKYEVSMECEAVEEEQQPMADPQQAAILESYRLAHD